MFKNASEARDWFKREAEVSLSDISKIQETGTYFLLINYTLVKVVVSKVSIRKITFAESEYPLLSNVSIFRSKISLKIVPLDRYLEFSEALEETKRLENRQREAIRVADKLDIKGFKAIKELSSDDQEKLIRLFPNI